MSTSDESGSYHHGDLRNALLAAATDLLAAGGVEAVSLREAARAAGVSHSAPYRHFPSREALLAAIAADGFRALRERLESHADGSVTGLGHAYLGFAADERARFLLMFGSAVPKADFPELGEAARAALAVLDRAVTGAAQTAWPVGQATIRAWALAHGLAQLVADGQIPREAAAAVLNG